MALTYSETPAQEIGKPAPEFALPGVDGKTWSLADFKEARALVVIFMCNHCPYVIAVQERINRLAKEFSSRGVRLVGINSNDPVRYPDDNFDAMKTRAAEQGYVFPYLQDRDQSVAKAYGAVCTPDPYVFENTGNQFKLRYHGRIDDNWKEESKVTRRELAEALESILEGGPGPDPKDQRPSMGCSIKWSQ